MFKIVTGIKPHTAGSAETILGTTRTIASVSIQKAPAEFPALQFVGAIHCQLTVPQDSYPSTSNDPLIAEAAARQVKKYQDLIELVLRHCIAPVEIRGLLIEVRATVICANGSLGCALVSSAWAALHEALAKAAQEGACEPVELRNIAAIICAVNHGKLFINPTTSIVAQSEFLGTFVVDSLERILDVEIRASGDGIQAAHLSMLAARVVAGSKPILAEQAAAVERGLEFVKTTERSHVQSNAA